jgi:hypothetical protein
VSLSPEIIGKVGVTERKISRITPVSTTSRPPPFPKTPVSGQKLVSDGKETQHTCMGIGFGADLRVRILG